jgi:hypothetical protein
MDLARRGLKILVLDYSEFWIIHRSNMLIGFSFIPSIMFQGHFSMAILEHLYQTVARFLSMMTDIFT